MPVVSIVSPVYNVGKYLPAFIESVMDQTFIDWELLLVDDGSTDGSSEICDRYAVKDNRIRVIHKTNGGVSSARNAGIRESVGEWLMMPDPDDILLKDALQVLLSYTSEDVDLISAGYERNEFGKIVPEEKPSETKKVSVEKFVEEISPLPQPRNLDRYCWNKLYRMSVIKENAVFFDVDLYFREDFLYVYRFFSHCSGNVQIISNKVYIYFMRNTGAAVSLQRCYSPKYAGRFIAITRCYDILEQMEVSSLTKRRMKKMMLTAYRRLSQLMCEAGAATKERQIYYNKLLQYYSRCEIYMANVRTICHRFLKTATRYFCPKTDVL